MTQAMTQTGRSFGADRARLGSGGRPPSMRWRWRVRGLVT